MKSASSERAGSCSSLARTVNVTELMARGWESKSVEAQMEEGLGRDERPDSQSLHELELTRQRESLETTRRGVARDLVNARTETHRAALQNALRFLDDELAKLR